MIKLTMLVLAGSLLLGQDAAKPAAVGAAPVKPVVQFTEVLALKWQVLSLREESLRAKIEQLEADKQALATATCQIAQLSMDKCQIDLQKGEILAKTPAK